MFNIKTASPLLGIISLPSLKEVFRDSRCSEIFAVSVLKPGVTISEFNFVPYLPYILESNPHPFCSFRGLKHQMRIRIAVESWILEK
jgi:hypothetical protein